MPPATPKRPEPQSREVTPFVFMSNTKASSHPAGREPSFKAFVASKAAEPFSGDVVEIDDAGDDEPD